MLGLDDVCTPEQVARFLKLNIATVWRYVRDGRLKAIKVGRLYRIRRGAVMDMLKKGENHDSK